ncbi:ABC transporter substrate-binding protein [Falsiroseomonas oryziterrae]|uniref:ABC transporter substrate-binding protein n=1 Tax=Falsiroseomonas oryziterrae TaxID=2911368 RepID=UPI001F411DCA|nr:ABC transporter substrate-binding protein [Roseomonas sp. NPKOSM-4]
MTTRRRTLLGAAALAPLATPFAAKGQAALTNVRFILDWAFQGPQGVYLMALDRGFFRDEGLNVTIDRGFGSADTPVKVQSGAYEFGIADISPMLRMRMTQAQTDLISPFVLAQGSPLAAMTLRRTGIRTPKDLEGKRVAAPETDAGRQFFPAFARAAGIDASRITWMTVTPQLREPMLARGDADAITGFETSGVFSLRAVNVNPADIVSFRYSAAGVQLLSTALMVRRPYAEANPRVVTAMIRAIVRGHVEAWRDPDAAIAALVRRDATAPAPLERERLVANFEFVRTPEVLSGGFANLTMQRVQGAVDTIRSAFDIAQPWNAADLYTAQYMPPAEQLRFPAAAG